LTKYIKYDINQCQSNDGLTIKHFVLSKEDTHVPRHQPLRPAQRAAEEDDEGRHPGGRHEALRRDRPRHPGRPDQQAAQVRRHRGRGPGHGQARPGGGRPAGRQRRRGQPRPHEGAGRQPAHLVLLVGFWPAQV